MRAELTADERRALGCTCWRMDGIWQHKRYCPVPRVEDMMTARLDRLTDEVKTFLRELRGLRPGKIVDATHELAMAMRKIYAGEP